MNILQSIAKRSYLATVEQVQTLAKANYEATVTSGETDSTYLKVLTAAAQAELGFSPRLRKSKGPASAAPEIEAALAAIDAANGKYYPAIVEAVTTDEIADKPTLRKAERSRRAQERNRRTNFARTTAYALRAYVKAGGNICALVVPTLTKTQLRAYVTDKQAPLAKDELVRRTAQSILSRVEAIRKERPEVVADLVTLVMAKLTSECGQETPTTTSPRKSVEEGIPLKTKDGTFWPVPARVPEVEGQQVMH